MDTTGLNTGGVRRFGAGAGTEFGGRSNGNEHEVESTHDTGA